MDNIVVSAIEDAVKQFELGALPDKSQQNNLIELVQQIEDKQELVAILKEIVVSDYCNSDSRIKALSAIGNLNPSIAFELVENSIKQGDKGNLEGGYGPKFNLQLLNKTVAEDWFASNDGDIDQHLRTWASAQTNSDENLRRRAQEYILNRKITAKEDARLVLQIVANEISSKEDQLPTSFSASIKNKESKEGPIIAHCVDLISEDIATNKSDENIACWKSLGLLKSAGHAVTFSNLSFSERLANGFKYEWKPLDGNAFGIQRILFISACSIALYTVMLLLSRLLSPEPYVVWFIISMFAICVLTLVCFDYVIAPISRSPDRRVSLIVELVRGAVVAAIITTLLLLTFFVLLPRDFANVLGYQSTLEFNRINGFWIWLSLIVIRPISSLDHEFIKSIKARILRTVNNEALIETIQSDVSTKVFKVVVSSATGIAILLANVYFDLGKEDYYESFFLIYSAPILFALAVMYSAIDSDTEDSSAVSEEERYPLIAGMVGVCSFVFCALVFVNSLGNWKEIETHNLSDKALALSEYSGDAGHLLHRQQIYFGINYTFKTDYLVSLDLNVEASEYKDIQVRHSKSDSVVDVRNGKTENFRLGNIFSDLQLCVAPSERSSVCSDEAQTGNLAHVVTLITNLLDTGSNSEIAFLEICDTSSNHCNFDSTANASAGNEKPDLAAEELEKRKQDNKTDETTYWASIREFQDERRALSSANTSHGEFNVAVQSSSDLESNSRLVPGTVLYTLNENWRNADSLPQLKHIVVMGMTNYKKKTLSAVDEQSLKNIDFQKLETGVESETSARARERAVKRWLDVSIASGKPGFISLRHPLYYPALVYGLFDDLPLLNELELRKNAVQNKTPFKGQYLLHYDHERLDTFVSGDNWRKPQPYTLYKINSESAAQYIASPYFGRLAGTLKGVHNQDCIVFSKSSPQSSNVFVVAEDEVDQIKSMIYKMDEIYSTETANQSKFYFNSYNPTAADVCLSDDAITKDYVPSDVFSTSSISGVELKLVVDQVYRIAGSEFDSVSIVSAKTTQSNVSEISDLQIAIRSLDGSDDMVFDEFGRENIESGTVRYKKNADYLICVSDSSHADSCQHLLKRKPSKEKWLTRRLKSQRLSADISNVVALRHAK